MEAGKRFCGECGTALASTDPVQAAPATIAERRLCSILFCDLVGFTPLSESRDPEEVRELLSRYFDTARTVITRYGGVVEKFIGDAVMAVWGTPVAVDGDAERAVRAGLELVDAISELGVQINAPDLAARAGIVTGEVAVTVGATNEGMVAGDSVNTAARVQSVAPPGAVFADATTRRLAEAGVEFTDAGEFELKGKAEPQRLWRAGRVLSNVGGGQRIDGLEAPLVGRDHEVRLIKELFHAAVDRRQLRLVAVTGEAGVGKSRLGWEFEKYVDGLADDVLWHRGHCLSYGDGVSFWALAEIVRQRLDIGEDDSAEVAAAKLAAGVLRHLTDVDERGYVGARLGRLLGVDYEDTAGVELPRVELFAGWRLWFERLAQTAPVVLLIEDLHNADAGLLDFLEYLIDWGRDAPIFVLTFGRPEMRVDRPSWGSGRNRTRLGVDPLDDASMTALLSELVHGLNGTAAAAIGTQARGIPLFAVETIRSLIDRDIVVPREGTYVLVGEVGALTVPDSLHALLAARLDTLTPRVRSLVADAAVLGSSFPAEPLAALGGRSEDEIAETLAELTRRGVLEIVVDPLSPQRGLYRFAHEMLRQVAYSTLSRHVRKDRHQAVAAHLRATFANDGEQLVDVIAQHYLDALSAVPDAQDAATLRDQAVDALRRAGERARRVGAPAGACISFTRAADVLLSAADTESKALAAVMLMEAADAAQRGGDLKSCAALAARAYGVLTDVGDLRGAARANVKWGGTLRTMADFAPARVHIDQALAVLRTDPDLDTAYALSQLAALLGAVGDVEEAERVSVEAGVIAQHNDADPHLLQILFNTRGIVLLALGRRSEGFMFLSESARLAELSGDTYAQSLGLSNLASMLVSTEPARAAVLARDGAALARRAGARFALSLATGNLVDALLATGDWDEAASVLDHAATEDLIGDDELVRLGAALLAALRGEDDVVRPLIAELEHLTTSDDLQDRAYFGVIVGLAAVAEGRYDDALAAAKRVLAEFDGNRDLNAEYGAWALAARSAYAMGDDAESDELFAWFDIQGSSPRTPLLQTERALALARQAARRADPSADQLFVSAISDQRRRSTPYYLAHGLLDHAEHLVRVGRQEDAREHIDEARGIAQRLGAKPLLARVADVSTALTLSPGGTPG